MEDEKPRRGRPRKADAAVAQLATDENDSKALDLTPEEETAEMVNQFKYQFVQMMKMADKLGIDLADVLDTPPVEDTVVLERQALEDEPISQVTVAETPASDVMALKPGTVLNGGTWIPWKKQHLDPNDMIEFVPQPVPSLLFPLTDEQGRMKIKLDVNDLVCWLTVGVPNKVNKFFYNAYANGYDSWKELENFKRNGPQWAPWGQRGPDGRPSWHYDPSAISFAMDNDGRYLRAQAGWSGPANVAADDSSLEE